MVTSTGRRRAGRAGLVALALSALLLTGCSGIGASSASSGTGGADSAAGSGSRAEAAPSAAPPAAAAADQGGDAAASTADLAGDADRQLVRTASADLLVDDAAAAADRVAVTVEGAGGRVEQRSVQDPVDGPATAQLVLRVPAATLNQTLEGLGAVGEVRDVDVTTSDVTARATDLDARIAALRTSTERLTALLAGAASTEEVVAAESALTQRQAELDSLTGQRALLAGEVEMASLSLSVSSREAAPVVEAGGFLGGLASGWRALVAAVSGALVVAGVLLPWLVAAALVVAVVVAAGRSLRALRGRRGGAAGGAASGSAGGSAGG